ncbi:MAG: PepSY domain-containing protein [Nitrosomonas sp.]|nr:PepSY domain-containing protein [Nitrosomonas sp.]
MNRWWKISIIALITISAFTPATAGKHSAAAERPAHSDPATGISEQKAIAIAQQHFKGRVLAINQTDHTYRIKILSEKGTVHTVLINTLDGTVVSTH